MGSKGIPSTGVVGAFEGEIRVAVASLNRVQGSARTA
jgi:hypothetical protein